MVRRAGIHYSIANNEEVMIKAKASNVAVKFRHLVEVAAAVRQMELVRANSYLKNVINHKECIPFRIYNGGVGKCAQAKQFKTVIGRWPRKAAKCMIDLLKNAASNCEFYGKDPCDFYIYHVQVNQAPVSTRRTYRSHGRITPYIRYNSHINLILKEKISLVQQPFLFQ
ncbi:60S ribosomal protein L17-like [Diorhabda carinulata]|uniref:60S ribosomal protein L17-like n=1 Tax=Diorhabda carinulata TaxID=1163345 RepID=UPI0025A15627|nr:60S ribosomal protein L17-like [Diorhabda carinulata]